MKGTPVRPEVLMEVPQSGNTSFATGRERGSSLSVGKVSWPPRPPVYCRRRLLCKRSDGDLPAELQFTARLWCAWDAWSQLPHSGCNNEDTKHSIWTFYTRNYYKWTLLKILTGFSELGFSPLKKLSSRIFKYLTVRMAMFANHFSWYHNQFLVASF